VVRLEAGPIDPGALLSAFCEGRRETGGVVSFTGLARADAGVQALELQAYPGFTDAAIGRLLDDAQARFAVQDLAVVHRIGRVEPGQAVVFVAAASAHRRAAFEAADYVMDHLKTAAPFWKREWREGGPVWIEPRGEDHADTSRWIEESRP
jgi:molybdopterin synthase catalytic subunit